MSWARVGGLTGWPGVVLAVGLAGALPAWAQAQTTESTLVDAVAGDGAPVLSLTLSHYLRTPLTAPGSQVEPVAWRTGKASWYGVRFKGRRSASGELFDPRAYTAAHRTLPLGSRVRVRNPANQREVVVRINDHGPRDAGRLIDLSRAAAQALGILHAGVATVDIQPQPPLTPTPLGDPT